MTLTQYQSKWWIRDAYKRRWADRFLAVICAGLGICLIIRAWTGYSTGEIWINRKVFCDLLIDIQSGGWFIAAIAESCFLGCLYLVPSLIFLFAPPLPKGLLRSRGLKLRLTPVLVILLLFGLASVSFRIRLAIEVPKCGRLILASNTVNLHN